MSELERVEQVVSEAGRRRRWQRAWTGLWRGMLVGAVAWLVGLGAYKALPLPDATLGIAGLAAVLCVVAGGLIGFCKATRRGPHDRPVAG